MGKLICLINDIDYSDEFISLQGLESTGPDVVGTATLLLRKTSGGLDLNPGMTVEVYEAFNDAGVGVKERGRYFGGFINMREGVGEMSSTFYTLNCVDNNILLDAITESVNNTLTVEAATFSDQILDIITTKQGAGGYLTRSIDAVSQVANITGASILPAIEFSNGETLREMIQAVCDNAILDNPAVEPRFFMHVDTTFGIGDSVGYAVLYIYDGALTPASSFHFKASALTNSGSDRPIYGQFRYKLDAAPTLITKLQSHWAGSSTATVEDAAAIAAYPNPYLSSGAWLAKPIEDTVSTTQAEAEAQLEAIISQTANPRRSIAFTSRQMVRPGEMVDITWPMEGITAQAYRVAGVSVLIPDNGDVACNITLDRMEMELGAPMVIGSSITTTGGGGGGGTFFGIQNPHNIEADYISLLNNNGDEVSQLSYSGLTFNRTDGPNDPVGTLVWRALSNGNIPGVGRVDINNSEFFFDNSAADFVAATEALATTATRGFMIIPSMDGPPTGTPATVLSGEYNPHLVFDVSTNTLWIYRYDADGSNGAWVNVASGTGGTAADPRIFNVKDYGALGDGSTDDTAEIQAAIDAAEAAGGGVVFFPAGVYVVGGALQDTGRSNAQLLLPRIDTSDEQITIVLRGESPPTQVPFVIGAAVVPDGGSIIKGTLNAGAGGALLGAWGPSGSYQDFSLLNVGIENLVFRMPSNPVLTAVNLSHVTAVQLQSVMVDTGNYDVSTVTEPSTTTSYGVRLPDNNNGAWTVVRDANVIGFYYGWGIGEHTNGDGMGAWACKYAANVIGLAHHATHIKRMLVVHCENGLTFTGGIHPIEIEQLDIEHWSASPSRWYDPISDVVDASNYGKGHITWHAVLSGTGSHNSFVVSGGSGLYTRRLQDAISGSGSVATDTIWDAAGDLAVGTGSNTAAKLPMGTALQQIRVNSGATALEYFTPSTSSGSITLAMIHEHVYQEDHTAETNGTKTNFILAQEYEPQTTEVWQAGLLLRPGIDYTEDSTYDAVTLASAPTTSTQLVLAYMAA